MAFDFGAEAVSAACRRHEFSSDDAARPRVRVGPGLHLLTAQGQSLSSQAVHTHTGFRDVQGKSSTQNATTSRIPENAFSGVSSIIFKVASGHRA